MGEITERVEDYLRYVAGVRQMSPVTVATKRSVLERFVRVTGVGSVAEVDNARLLCWVEWNIARGVASGTTGGEYRRAEGAVCR